MNKNIVLLDLFSGIGGFHAGLTRAGFNITKSYTSEIDKHAIAIYKYHFKNSEYVGDVTSLDGKSITRPNIITFGSPCQDFSVAGKRAGLEGQRSSLVGQAIRLITECRPDFFIWENVKGVFSSNNGEDFWAVIQAFTDIGGYRLEWQLLNTAWFLPQNRERIYLIGHLAKDGRNWQGVFPIGENNIQDDKLQGQSTNTIKARYEANGDGSYIIENKFDAQINLVGHSGSGGYHGNIYGENGVMSCLTGTDYKQPKQILIEPTHKHGDERSYEDIAPTIQSRYGTGGDNVPYVMQINPSLESGGKQPYQQNRVYDDQGIAPALHSLTEKMNIANTVTPDAYLAKGERKRDENGKAVLTSMHERRIRRLTEIECERLQGFEDDWTQWGDYNGEIKEVSRTQRYKCLGNAVTVNVVTEVGRRLLLL